ncbi:MAG: ATP synthase subunit I [Bryobacteraceae bacterium]
MGHEEKTKPEGETSRVIARVMRWQLSLAAAGAPAWWAARDGLHALAFAVGAAAAITSFWMLERLTAAMGGPTSGAGLAASGLRLVLIGGALFVIITNYKLPVVPLGSGVLVTVAAITIEGIRELFYARTLDH